MTATVDMTKLSAMHTSEESRSRVRSRHNSEIRLKAYGLIAITLAAAALIILTWSVVSRMTSVVYEYYLSLETQVEVSERDRQILDDPNPRLRASLNGPWRDAIEEAVEGELSRTDRRQLYALLSRDAGLFLGDLVKADPSLIGETIRFEALLDDETQMYLKGAIGELEPVASQGTLRLSAVEGSEEIELRLDPRALAEARSAMRDHLTTLAVRVREDRDRQAYAIAQTEAALEGAEGEERERQLALLKRFTDARNQAEARYEQLQIAATSQGTEFSLDETAPSVLIRVNQGWIKLTELTQERALGVPLDPLSSLDDAPEGSWTGFLFRRAENTRLFSDQQIVWLDNFQREGKIVSQLNWRLLASSDSSNAELAGIWGALVGSFWTMIVTFLLAFPIGVMASIYLEEFAPKNRITDFIEVNINNLAAVPSIVFGLLGITVLISGVRLFDVELFDGLLKNIVEDPRSTPLAGGVVLALMSLPTIIIAARASIKAVPPSIRDAALGVGASKLQTATHHVLPLAMPGIMTGSIIAMAQALGETAPLIIIGMNSFIQEAPADPFSKGNVLPSLIYIWKNNSERLFDGKTAMAITVLLIFLVAMNGLAVLLRKRFERRW